MEVRNRIEPRRVRRFPGDPMESRSAAAEAWGINPSESLGDLKKGRKGEARSPNSKRGLAKLPSMSRRKNPNAIEVMRSIKKALDPNNIMNPGKVIPAR